MAERFGVIVRTPRRYEGSFPASPIGARQARCAVTAFAKVLLRGRDLTDFESAIGEVLANAVEHGGGTRITVECYVHSGRVVAEIQDYGAGFLPPEAIKPPTGGALRGYGLFIVHRLLDKVEYLDNGCRLRLVKSSSRESG
jgi:anti-sigma regulatory factor (Ser/Thr protein kinase)